MPQNLHGYLNRRQRDEAALITHDLGRKIRYRVGLLLHDDPASRTVRRWLEDWAAGEAPAPARRRAPAAACPECGVGAGLHADERPLAAQEGAGAPAGAGAADGSGSVPGRAQGRSGRRGGA